MVSSFSKLSLKSSDWTALCLLHWRSYQLRFAMGSYTSEKRKREESYIPSAESWRFAWKKKEVQKRGPSVVPVACMRTLVLVQHWLRCERNFYSLQCGLNWHPLASNTFPYRQHWKERERGNLSCTVILKVLIKMFLLCSLWNFCNLLCSCLGMQPGHSETLLIFYVF